MAMNNGPDDWISRALRASVYSSAQYCSELKMLMPVNDSTIMRPSRSRMAGQSRTRWGQANGSAMMKAADQRRIDRVIGGKWPAIARPTTALPAQNSGASDSRR